MILRLFLLSQQLFFDFLCSHFNLLRVIQFLRSIFFFIIFILALAIFLFVTLFLLALLLWWTVFEIFRIANIWRIPYHCLPSSHIVLFQPCESTNSQLDLVLCISQKHYFLAFLIISCSRSSILSCLSFNEWIASYLLHISQSYVLIVTALCQHLYFDAFGSNHKLSFHAAKLGM
jgi:hypothetical protein